MMLAVLLLFFQLNNMQAAEKRFPILRLTVALNQRDFEKARYMMKECVLETGWVMEKILTEAVFQGDLEKARFLIEMGCNVGFSPCDPLFMAAVENGHASMVRLFIRSPGFNPRLLEVESSLFDKISDNQSLLAMLLLHRDTVAHNTQKGNYLMMLADPRVNIDESDSRPGVDHLRSCKLGVTPQLENIEKYLLQMLLRCAGTLGNLRLFLDLLEEFRKLASDNDSFLREIDYLVDYAWTFNQYDVISAAFFTSGLFTEMPTDPSSCLLWLEFKSKSMHHGQLYVLAGLFETYTRHYLLQRYLHLHLDGNVADIALTIWRTQIALLQP